MKHRRKKAFSHCFSHFICNPTDRGLSPVLNTVGGELYWEFSLAICWDVRRKSGSAEGMRIGLALVWGLQKETGQDRLAVWTFDMETCESSLQLYLLNLFKSVEIHLENNTFPWRFSLILLWQDDTSGILQGCFIRRLLVYLEYLV